MPAWEDLPEDVLITIFFLLDPEDVCRSGEVSTAFHAVSISEVLWKSFSKQLFSRYYPDGVAAYDRDLQQCWKARCERRQARLEASRQRVQSTLRKWKEGGSGGGGGGGSPSFGGDAYLAGGEEEAPMEGSGSDTELDALDAAAVEAKRRSVDEALGRVPSSLAVANPGEKERSQERSQKCEARRALRSSRRAAAEHLTHLRATALNDFKVVLKGPAGGLARLAYPGIPALRCGDGGVYAMRCWYIRKGAPNGGPSDPVLHCVYYRVMLFREDGTLLYCQFPGELPEALKFLKRTLSRESHGSGGGGGEAGGGGGGGEGGGGGGRGNEDWLWEWGPPPGPSGLGEPRPPGDLTKVIRGREEKGVGYVGEDGVSIAAPPPPPPPPPPRDGNRRLKREERGNRTVGRGVWRQEGSRVEAVYIMGGHSIQSLWVMTLSSAPVIPGGYYEVEGGTFLPVPPTKAIYSHRCATLTTDLMLTGESTGESMPLDSLKGEVFHWYNISSGVIGLP